MSNSNHASRINNETIDAVDAKRIVTTVVIVTIFLSSITGFLLAKKYLTFELLVRWFV